MSHDLAKWNGDINAVKILCDCFASIDNLNIAFSNQIFGILQNRARKNVPRSLFSTLYFLSFAGLSDTMMKNAEKNYHSLLNSSTSSICSSELYLIHPREVLLGLHYLGFGSNQDRLSFDRVNEMTDSMPIIPVNHLFFIKNDKIDDDGDILITWSNRIVNFFKISFSSLEYMLSISKIVAPDSSTHYYAEYDDDVIKMIEMFMISSCDTRLNENIQQSIECIVVLYLLYCQPRHSSTHNRDNLDEHLQATLNRVIENHNISVISLTQICTRLSNIYHVRNHDEKVIIYRLQHQLMNSIIKIRLMHFSSLNDCKIDPRKIVNEKFWLFDKKIENIQRSIENIIKIAKINALDMDSLVSFFHIVFSLLSVEEIHNTSSLYDNYKNTLISINDSCEKFLFHIIDKNMKVDNTIDNDCEQEKLDDLRVTVDAIMFICRK